jgi:Family of unknown function (DUF6011)
MSAKPEAEPNLEAMMTLAAGVAKLEQRHHPFAKSLCAQFAAKGQLSGSQWHWVEQFADQIECYGVPDFTKLTKKPVQLDSFKGVFDLFETAKQHLKYPTILLKLPDGSNLRLSLPGPSSKYHGKVGLTDGKPYGQNKWYGAIDPAGQWTPSEAGKAIKDDLTQILAKLAQNPARVAAEYGKLTGCCCFCNSTLTDEKSTDVGYGPVCAKRFGLPWGAAK